MNLPAKKNDQNIYAKFASKLNWQDAIAGLSIAGLLLPQALAYSGIGNLPAQAGIIGLFAGLLCYGSVSYTHLTLPTNSRV